MMKIGEKLAVINTIWYYWHTIEYAESNYGWIHTSGKDFIILVPEIVLRRNND